MSRKMKNNELRQLYDKWHAIQHGTDNTSEIHMDPWHRNVIKYIGDFSTFKNKNILDIGTGPGDFALFISDYAKSTAAIDFSENAIGIARGKATVQNKEILFEVADAMDLPFENQTFDVVFSFECLEHVPEPVKMIKECYRVLRKGGKLYITTENYSNGLIILWIRAWITGRKFNSGTDQPYENFFVYWSLLKKFRKSGFKLINYFGSHHVFLVLPGMHPHRFVIDSFSNKLFKKLFKPLARHMTYVLEKQ